MAEIVDEPIFRDRVHVFDDRFHAGELLAAKLGEYEGMKNAYTLAIPAGGVQVAFPVAKRLRLPLDLVITRKIHVPWNKEAGFGAISWNGLVFLNEPLVASLRLTKEDVNRCVAEEKEAIRRRLEMFRGSKPFPDLKNKTAIIIDDGLASGFSMLTTIRAIRQSGVKETVVVVPTAPISAIELIRPHADKIVCLNIRSGPSFAVADAYKVWRDLEDQDVVKILKLA
jgi:predicted phosphoribosyltransferase